MPTSLFTAAAACLGTKSLNEKVALSQSYAQQWRSGGLDLEYQQPPEPIGEPGRPLKPRLVAPRELNARKISTPEGHAALIHAICHIEFNAIDLAWDAVYRFREMPREFYDSWVRVADEEAYHFTLLREHLQGLGYDYGDFDAHNGLWEMAQKTAHDALVRMALVPRVLEARGLDVTPGIMAKLSKIGDRKAVTILEIIFRDEIGHVEIGSHWFEYLCRERNMDPKSTFKELLEQYMKGSLKGPFHKEARLKAGFSEEEISYLEGMG
ncbi:MAG: ferritin-like domain-containing protein [Gammaproteobacteria bacterium]|nr:ferritin-like domain-containing protein [Gammaproteobacteria bacterium]